MIAGLVTSSPGSLGGGLDCSVLSVGSHSRVVDEPFLLCSACYTPTPATEAHVVPRWRAEVPGVITAYRCGNCWLGSLAELRAALSSDPEAQLGFCDFLARRGYEQAAETLRAAPGGERLRSLLAVLDEVQAERLRFDP